MGRRKHVSKARKVLGDRKKKDKQMGFTRATVYAKDAVYIMCFDEDLGDEKENVLVVQKWSGSWMHWKVGWACISNVSGDLEEKRTVLTLGLGGRVHVANAKGFAEEHIDPSKDGPEYQGMMRDIRIIGEHAYAAGMGRQVYRREGKNKWKRIDQ